MWPVSLGEIGAESAEINWAQKGDFARLAEKVGKRHADHLVVFVRSRRQLTAVHEPFLGCQELVHQLLAGEPITPARRPAGIQIVSLIQVEVHRGVGVFPSTEIPDLAVDFLRPLAAVVRKQRVVFAGLGGLGSVWYLWRHNLCFPGPTGGAEVWRRVWAPEAAINPTSKTLENKAQMPIGDVAQLGEHRLCKAGVEGSIPFVSIFYTRSNLT